MRTVICIIASPDLAIYVDDAHVSLKPSDAGHSAIVNGGDEQMYWLCRHAESILPVGLAVNKWEACYKMSGSSIG